MTTEAESGAVVLVVGSYPPVRTPGAAATLDQVRRVVDAGGEPRVASPRASAAIYTSAVSGLLAGRRLANLKRVSGAGHVIFCVERDLPIPTTFAVRPLLPLVQRIALQEVRRTLRHFARVTIVVADDLGVPAGLEAALVGVAADVKDEREQYRHEGAPGVSVLGPDERTPQEQLVDLVDKIARRALGPGYPRVRALIARVVHTAKARAGR